MTTQPQAQPQNTNVTIGQTAYTFTKRLYPAAGVNTTKSEVWLATDPNGQEVVIKHLADQNRKEFFKQCARGTAEAAKYSKSVIKVHQYDDQYVVMDNGGESLERKLQDKIKELGFTVESEEWIAQVCSWGLNAAYALKSLHELSPPRYSGDAHWGNFVCDQQGMVRICDLAGSSANLPVAYNSADIQFHPPFEEGKPEPTSAKYDLYVLCQSLALLFTGKTKPRVSYIRNHNKNLPQQLIDLIDDAREERIDKRKYGTMNEFITAWEKIITDSPGLGFEIQICVHPQIKETYRAVYPPATGFSQYLAQLKSKMQGSQLSFGKKDFDELVDKFTEYNGRSKNSPKISALLETFVSAELVPYLQKQLKSKEDGINDKKKEYAARKKQLEVEAKLAKRELDALNGKIGEYHEQIRGYKSITDGLSNSQGLKAAVGNLAALPQLEIEALTAFLKNFSQPDTKADITAIITALLK